MPTETYWGAWGSALIVVAIATGCANGPNAQSLEQTLAADPQLNGNSGVLGSNPTQLPADFPSEIPRFPGAALVAVETLAGNQGLVTRWQSSQASDRIVQFYRQAFLVNNWQITNRPEDDRQGEFVAQRPDLSVTVTIAAAATPLTNATPATPETAGSQFRIQYRQTRARPSDSMAGNNTSNNTGQNTGNNSGNPPQNQATPTGQAVNVPASPFQDLAQAPQPLQNYIANLSQLDVFTPASGRFQPNQPITRREFVRWMMTAQNKIYAHRPALQIRTTTTATTTLFQDIPKSDPDFAVIQGAAEAGIIPSSLSGDATAIIFRPNVPLTRETLLLWKVPLDLRQPLPTASVNAVKEVWGFQDAARISPNALKAVLADHQNGEQSNISRTFGYTTLFQPQRPVTRAEAAACLWYFGIQGDGLSAEDARQIQTATQSTNLKPSLAERTNNPLSPSNSSTPNTPNNLNNPPPSPIIPDSTQQFGPPLPQP